MTTEKLITEIVLWIRDNETRTQAHPCSDVVRKIESDKLIEFIRMLQEQES